MSRIHKIIVETVTPFNISTGNKSNGFIKNLTIKDSEGKPYIPGSTIKGLIRDNYRSICNNSDEIFGKEGYNPSKVIVEDLKLKSSDSNTSVRFGNAIDRYRGVSKENALYSKEVATGIFEGYIHILEESDEINDDIELAIKMISALGSGKSTGFGKVTIIVEKDVEINNDSKVEKLYNSKNFALNFYSPLFIGGKQKSYNFMKTDTVIKGSVVRAAFAKIILNNCTENQNDTKDKENWVYYRDKENCLKCNFANICKEFSHLKFSYFYPQGSEIIPLSAKTCKTHEKEHGFMDELTYYDEEDECPCCKLLTNTNSRLEFKSGLRTAEIIIDKNSVENINSIDKDVISNKRMYKVTTNVATKNAIDQYTKTSKDGMLYSMERIVDVQGTDREKLDNDIMFRYTGKIEGLENVPDKELRNFIDLRIGGDTTSGLGKCTLQSIKEENNTKKNLIQDFTKIYSKIRREKFYEEEQPDFNYLAIKFTGDCKLNFDFNNSYKTTQELKKLWEEALWENAKFKDNSIKFNKEMIYVDRVYTEFINYRGYDSSKSTEDKREDVVRLAVNGTVIVFGSSYKANQLFNIFNSISGFGLEQENGFGAFEIYFGGLEDGSKRK